MACGHSELLVSCCKGAKRMSARLSKIGLYSAIFFYGADRSCGSMDLLWPGLDEHVEGYHSMILVGQARHSASCALTPPPQRGYAGQSCLRVTRGDALAATTPGAGHSGAIP